MEKMPCKHVDSDAEQCSVGRSFPVNCREGCKSYLPILDDADRIRCEIWSRVMGYHRPITSWNEGKKGEWEDRQPFHMPSGEQLTSDIDD